MNRNILIAVGVVLAALALSGKNPFITKYNGIPTVNSVPPPPPPFAAFGPDCEIAPVSKEHLFVAASVYQGDTLINVQLGDSTGGTTMVRIAVASGEQPITVLLQSSQPVIFSFEGEVGRVARAIVIAGYRDSVAVSGLPAA